MSGIDPATFARWLAVFADRYGRPLGQVSQKLYYDTLSAHLTTDEFVQACRSVFDTEAFLPPPMVFVYRVKPTPQALAVAAWAELMDAIRQNRRADLDPTASAALRDAGGRPAIERCDADKDLPHIRRAFLAAYRDRAENAHVEAAPAALPAPGPLGFLEAGEGGEA